MISNDEKKLRRMTCEEWRKLGFYFEPNEKMKKLIFTGSKKGLKNFTLLIQEYVYYKPNERISEHSHYGPYMNLKIMTWNEAQINEKHICGSIKKLSELAILVRKKIDNCRQGDTFFIQEEFTLDAEYSLEFNLMSDEYDPALIDIEYWQANGERVEENFDHLL